MQTLMSFVSPVDYTLYGHTGLSAKINGNGDLNGDGFNDIVIVGHPIGEPQWQTKLYIYLGGSTPDSIADYIIEDPQATSNRGNFGTSIAFGNDINGDGIDDLVVGNPNAGYNGEGKVYIYFGSEQIHTIPDIVLEGWNYAEDSFGLKFGFKIDTSGDFNGDGFHDLVVSSTGPSFYFNGQIDIFWGGPAFDTIADWHHQGTELEFFGYAIAVGDFSGDGEPDLAVSSRASDMDTYEIYSGGSVMDNIPEFTQTVSSSHIIKMIMNGDLENDGFDDLFVYSTGLYFQHGSSDFAGGLLLFPEIDINGNICSFFYSRFNNNDYLTVSMPMDSIIYILSCDSQDVVFPIYTVNSDNNHLGRSEMGYFLGDCNGDENNEFIISTWNNDVCYFKVFTTELNANDDHTEATSSITAICYPNPTSLGSNISFSLQKSQKVDIVLYNSKGQRVKTISQNTSFKSGSHQLYWDGKDENQRKCASGIYFLHILGDKSRIVKKIMHLK